MSRDGGVLVLALRRPELDEQTGGDSGGSELLKLDRVKKNEVLPSARHSGKKKKKN